MDPSAEIRFDGWTLRRQPRELFRNGVRIRLQDQPLHVLEELLTRPGELVTREQLTARLWPKRVVDFDTALNAAVRRLRAALRDEAETPRYIETIPRQGYRFIGVVEPARPVEGAASGEPTQARHPPPKRWFARAVVALLLLGAIGGAVLWSARTHDGATPADDGEPPTTVAATSIAVLPFADLSPEQDQQHFSDGLAEELLNLLAQSKQLRVIARTSSFSFRGQNVDIATVARKLNVTHVLEGSVRKSGDRVRITAQLVDAANSSHLWSQTYDRELPDILAVQSDIANSVASALRVALGDSASHSAASDAQAYELLLRAHFLFQRRAPGDLDHAKNYYQQALDIDPKFARAWAGLGGVYWIQTVNGVLESDVGLERLREAAERALAIDPNLVEAHLRMANYFWGVGDGVAARRHFDRAAALAPSHPLVLGFRGGYASENGRWDEAIELQRRAVAADPLSITDRHNLAATFFYAGRFDAAKIESVKAGELNPTRPEDIEALALVLERRFEEALRLVEAWPESVERAQCLALVYTGLGRRAQADAALEGLIASFGATDPFRIAEVYGYRGEAEPAFKWLQTTSSLPWLRRPPLMRYSPFLISLHADPRWNTWVAAAQRPAA